jgi:hypothetical protein
MNTRYSTYVYTVEKNYIKLNFTVLRVCFFLKKERKNKMNFYVADVSNCSLPSSNNAFNYLPDL